MASTIPLEEQIRIASNIIEDNQYAYNRAKNPKAKRVHKNTLEFWESIQESLKELESLKNDSSGKSS